MLQFLYTIMVLYLLTFMFIICIYFWGSGVHTKVHTGDNTPIAPPVHWDGSGIKVSSSIKSLSRCWKWWRGEQLWWGRRGKERKITVLNLTATVMCHTVDQVWSNIARGQLKHRGLDFFIRGKSFILILKWSITDFPTRSPLLRSLYIPRSHVWLPNCR